MFHGARAEDIDNFQSTLVVVEDSVYSSGHFNGHFATRRGGEAEVTQHFLD